MSREVEKYDFKAFGQAIKAARKAARKAKGISRNQLADKMNIAPRRTPYYPADRALFSQV